MKNEINIDPKRKHDITIEEVRSCPMFAHFTDEQAMEVINTLKQFTLIVYDAYQKGKDESKSD
jgi:hypothetical protein